MSEQVFEYVFPTGGGHNGLLRFDGRIVEYINMANYGNVRYPFPETTIEKGEPNRKGLVEYKFFNAQHQPVMDFPVEEAAVAGFDDFFAKVAKACAK